MPHVPRGKLAVVRQVACVLRVLHPTRFRAWRASSFRCSRDLLVSCPTCHCASCTSCCMYPHTLCSFTCFCVIRASCLTCSRDPRTLCRTTSRASSVLRALAPHVSYALGVLVLLLPCSLSTLVLLIPDLLQVFHFRKGAPMVFLLQDLLTLLN